MDLAARCLMAFTVLNALVLAADLFYNVYHSLFPL